MGTKLNHVDIDIVEYNGHIYILQQYLHLCTGEVRSAFTRPVLAFRFDMTRLRVAFVCGLGRIRQHTSLRLRALIMSWRGVYVCKFRSTRTGFQLKKNLPVEHSSEHFCCVGTHFEAFMNLADVFCLRWFSEARKKHFRRNFRKCSRMRAIVGKFEM